jgi:hypothetical protein
LHNSTTGENYVCNDVPGNVHHQGFSSQVILGGHLDLQMGEPGLSGVDNDPPEPSPPPSVPPLDGDADNYALSNVQCFCCIADCVEKISLQQWGHNHVQQCIVEESDEEDEFAMEDEDFINSDENLQKDEDDYEMPVAEPGQEGVSVWDLLSESFLKKAS